MSESIPIHVEASFKEAWALFGKAPEVFITIAFALLGAVMVLGSWPVIGQFASLLLSAVGPAAFFLVAQEVASKGSASFESLKGLVPLFPQLLALTVVKSLIVGVGFLLLVLPGIYLCVLLAFADLFVVTENKSFVDALKASRDLVHGSWFRVFGLLIVIGVIAFSGVLLIGIGLLATIPFAALMLFTAFRRARSPLVVG